MVLVFAEASNGKFKKAAFEAVTYGAKTAAALGTECHALTLGEADAAGELGRYGAQKVYHLNAPELATFDSAVYTAAIAGAAQAIGAKVIVLMHNSTGKNLVGRLAARLEAGSAPGVNALPKVEGGKFTVRKAVFSGKAFAEVEILTDYKIISLAGNSIPVEESGAAVAVESLNVALPAPKTKVLETKRAEGITPLPEAELVVSGGRGLKGPENWGVITDLADALGATTACSRPVADVHWRPHHEHVGQTGVAIRPNLYIAAGISGAIQHLAGVNSSKTIVVINKDPEAPFFKAADYGVVGDLFEVLPRLTEAIKKHKGV
ncbi:electron transfer flavoprotein subunit alpha/FixB family protein [Neolewinella lacunae]|uniref:Electron transfer flavoprotein subunit alpha/FixB family protein n=1 Tax=Neolewinella lacunae TaxID=1517758 RepID=A0A923PJ59_9BACT|nr:electron transfer flavoprotein subunit alpha/FixB family protein [Neolewinella lacunae]MBC6993651.1 electron transfer flavoprotein subunit alpha/FixB family protein [Neolewinella lacunae]MDN3634721.1 electron transfer flavoprotein subunit alpha/FixB family protein [Neolewinella lacunae]